MTQDYYRQHAQAFFDGTVNVDMAALYAPFTARLAPGARVLDAGCGSGRDSKAFVQMGYQVDAFDASAELAALASAHAGIPVAQMTFAGVAAVETFDGIWCCASLLHVSAGELPAVMQRLAWALKPGGVWYVSFKYGDGEREKDGRRFTDMHEESLRGLVAPLSGVSVASLWTTQDVRPDRDERWLNAILHKA
nr:class I SAM-dependent methyltransferase [uncultured Enterobacter sp.]